MNEKLKKDIEAILNGSTTIEETQHILSMVSKEDIRQLFPKEDIDALLESYRKNSDFTHEPIPHVTESEKDALWKRIKEGSKQSSPSSQGFFNRVKMIFKGLIPSAGMMTSRHLGYALASLLILFAVPSILLLNKQAPEYTGIKGDDLPSATLQFAIVGQNNALIRPDRPLTEKDVLAFRVKVAKKGYFSVYMVFNGNVDLIISDKLLEKGVHDLSEIYHLEGNNGGNTLILVSATDKVTQDDVLTEQLVVESALNNAPLLTIEEIHINLSYETINIE